MSRSYRCDACVLIFQCAWSRFSDIVGRLLSTSRVWLLWCSPLALCIVRATITKKILYCSGRQTWHRSNKHAPMPELIVAPASTSQSALPPPPAAFQPTLRILKRPSPNIGGTPVGTLSSASSPSSGPISTPGSGATSPTPRGTLAEREAQYQEARSRIFGERERGLGGASSGSMSRTSSSLGGVHVVRDPLGPPPTGSATGSEPEPDRPAKGFGERRRGKMKNEMK